MRSTLHPSTHLGFPIIQVLVEAISAIGTAFVLLGDLIAPRLRTPKKTDHSEPPDAMKDLALA